jgi:hypothetical protein
MRIDSLSGEILLGSAGTGKTGAPSRASIFKSNTGDLYLFGRKITFQANERTVVRDGSLIAIADGTGADDGITLSSTAATNYLILVSSGTPAGANSTADASIHIRSRPAATIEVGVGNNPTPNDNGTELIAAAVYFYNGNIGNSPTRQAFAPAPSTTNSFSYTTGRTGNVTSRNGFTLVDVLTHDQTSQTYSVYIADLVVTNQFRPHPVPFLLYLDLTTAGLTLRDNPAQPPQFISPTNDLFGVNLLPMRTLSTVGAAPRTVFGSAFTPNVPLETREATPIEVDLSPAVREQLQALGIYARGLRAAEIRSRELRRGLFVSVPERERPREPDYEVAEARVENRAVREVLRLAEEAGLIGTEQQKLDDVAKALADSYAAFEVLSLGTEAKDFRAWLEKSENQDAKVVLSYLQNLHQTLERIKLLGLTPHELASSKSQIYGSILRARLNAEPEFLRALVEGDDSSTKVSSIENSPVVPAKLAQAGIE